MILLVNGPNLNLLGEREPEIYGSTTHAELAHQCVEWGTDLGLDVEVRQTNHEGDLLDGGSLTRIVRAVRPHEVYNLAAQSFVPTSWKQPVLTAEFTAVAVTRLLEAMRILGLKDRTRFYQASTSELYGNMPAPQSETTPFAPRSPYAAAKVYAYWITVNYREAYGIFGSNGILFNHESPRRGETFVTRKITRAVAHIHHGLQDKLYLGNLNARRDWGHARDYVEGMWAIMQHDKADDFVLATGEDHSVREFVQDRKSTRLNSSHRT